MTACGAEASACGAAATIGVCGADASACGVAVGIDSPVDVGVCGVDVGDGDIVSCCAVNVIPVLPSC